jgi:hypothetical protein
LMLWISRDGITFVTGLRLTIIKRGMCLQCLIIKGKFIAWDSSIA